MAINYSKVARSCPVGSETKKVYATAQYTSVMTLSEFAKHISDHNSVFDRATISGVLTATVMCLRELLLDGKKVQLGDLGSFYVSLKSTGKDSAEEFSAADITAVNVKWSQGSEFADLINDATFNLVATRALQAQARDTRNGEVNDAVGAEGSGSGTGGGDTGQLG